MKLHIKSAFAGAGVSVLVLVTIAAVAQGSGALRVFVTNTVDVAGIPSPDQLVRVEEGTPFTVPSDKVLVMTGVIHDGGASGVTYRILVDGTVRIAGGLDSGGVEASSDVFFWGYRVDSGSVVEITESYVGNTATILGYLADIHA